MTAQEYRQAGYKVSAQIDQSEIDRAEKDVLQAYVYPILSDADPTGDEVVRDTVMSFAFLLLLQRSISATRSGAKEKTTPQSVSADLWHILSMQAATCQMKIDALKQKTGANLKAEVKDICGIYFRTQYFYI